MNVLRIYDAYRYIFLHHYKITDLQEKEKSETDSQIHWFSKKWNNIIFFFFQRYPMANIQMHISIKPIYDWSMCLTASADERLACITQTSLHSTISFMNRYLATVAQNWIISKSLLTYTIGPLTFLLHPIFYTTNTTSTLLPDIFPIFHVANLMQSGTLKVFSCPPNQLPCTASGLSPS